ncbi:MAG: hypothetical protein Q9211_005526, partial [Gyalolechia sp. 1 TL-2023]
MAATAQDLGTSAQTPAPNHSTPDICSHLPIADASFPNPSPEIQNIPPIIDNSFFTAQLARRPLLFPPSPTQKGAGTQAQHRLLRGLRRRLTLPSILTAKLLNYAWSKGLPAEVHAPAGRGVEVLGIVVGD